MMNEQPEFWLSGPVPGVIPLLQPVVHALLQAQREIQTLLYRFPDESIWKKPGGCASVAFHLAHIAGVIDRMITYADGNSLSDEQFDFLSREGKEAGDVNATSLLQHLENTFGKAQTYLQTVSAETLTETRYVGRKKIPTSKIGLLVHAAEHTMRHTGQLLVTVKVLTSKND